MAALIIGVIVAGLGIGALVSAFQNRGTLPELGATSIPQVTPVPQLTGPQPQITLAPTAAPSPSPTPSPTPSPKPSPSANPSPTPSPSPSPAASVTPRATAAPSAAASGATAVPLAAASASPRPVSTAALKPIIVVVTPSPSPSTRPTAVASVHLTVPASSADPALALVRRYIEDLIAGDETGAYAALGGTSSDRTLDLKEEAFLDKDAHITSMRVSRSDGTGATVDAAITSAHGSYAATFHVTYGPNGSIITQHDYIKI
jgi:hypothetical protein